MSWPFCRSRDAWVSLLDVVEDDEYGQFSVSDLRRRINSDVKLVAMTQVPTGGVAVDYGLSLGLEALKDRVQTLAESLRARLREIPGVVVHYRGRRLCGIVTFTVDGIDCEAVRRALCATGIKVSVTALDAAQLDLPGRGLSELVRASVHYYNTGEELARSAAALPAARPN